MATSRTTQALSRRKLLRAAGAVGLAAPLGFVGRRVLGPCWPTVGRSRARIRRASWCSRTRRSIPGARSGTMPRSVPRRAACCATSAAGSTRRCGWSACRASPAPIPTSCRAAWPSAPRSRALVNEPRLLILDEPLGKLDSLTRLSMQGELVALWQRAGFTALLVTHDVEEALLLATRVIVFSERPARITAEVVNDRPYPRHRGDPYLVEQRRHVLGLLGLAAA